MSGIARAVSRVFTGMRRIGFAAAALGLLFAAVPARAQLVPITRCNSAIPCNIPYGLRPADADVGLADRVANAGFDERIVEARPLRPR